MSDSHIIGRFQLKEVVFRERRWILMNDIDEIVRKEKLQNVIRPRLMEGVLVSIHERGVSEIGGMRGLFLLNSASKFTHLYIQRRCNLPV